MTKNFRKSNSNPNPLQRAGGAVFRLYVSVKQSWLGLLAGFQRRWRAWLVQSKPFARLGEGLRQMAMLCKAVCIALKPYLPLLQLIAVLWSLFGGSSEC